MSLFSGCPSFAIFSLSLSLHLYPPIGARQHGPPARDNGYENLGLLTVNNKHSCRHPLPTPRAMSDHLGPLHTHPHHAD